MSATQARTNGRSRGPRVTGARGGEPTSAKAAGSELAEAVLAVQAEAGKLMRNATGQIQNRTYGYVTLDAVVDEVLPLLVSHQLLWRTFPTTVINEQTGLAEPGLRYRMTHLPSGEYDEDVMLLLVVSPSPQNQGSGLTYARRYALTAYLNLTIDPDDDALRASTPPPSTAQPERPDESGQEGEGSPQPTARPPKPSERRITANQREKLLKPRARAAKLTAGEFANVILTAAGDQPREWKDEAHATQTLGRLLDQLPARLKDKVLEGIEQAKVAKA